MKQTITVKTNNHWHNFKYRDEVPAAILGSEFDYQDEDDSFDGFIQYRGNWYHLDGFMRMDSTSELSDWHGYASDSYFSGVVIRVSEDGEQYQIGTYFS
jgi:hypothetical protein